MKQPAATLEPPEPPTEVLSFVLHGAPAVQEIERSIARWGYAHSEPGALADADAAEAGLSVVSGVCLDTLYPDTIEGRAAWKASRR